MKTWHAWHIPAGIDWLEGVQVEGVARQTPAINHALAPMSGLISPGVISLIGAVSTVRVRWNRTSRAPP